MPKIAIIVALGENMKGTPGLAGRAFGALMGGAVWQHGGIFAIGCVSGLLTLMGIGCLIYGLRGWRQSPE